MRPEPDCKPLNSILLVEDDRDTLSLLVTIVSMKFPAAVLHYADNGRTALELYREHLPGIVITDINMPEMDGVQLAGNIRARNSGTKIIVLTANTGKIRLEHDDGEKFEIDHFILKPLDFGMLFAAIEQCLCQEHARL